MQKPLLCGVSSAEYAACGAIYVSLASAHAWLKEKHPRSCTCENPGPICRGVGRFAPLLAGKPCLISSFTSQRVTISFSVIVVSVRLARGLFHKYCNLPSPWAGRSVRLNVNAIRVSGNTFTRRNASTPHVHLRSSLRYFWDCPRGRQTSPLLASAETDTGVPNLISRAWRRQKRGCWDHSRGIGLRSARRLDKITCVPVLQCRRHYFILDAFPCVALNPLYRHADAA